MVLDLYADRIWHTTITAAEHAGRHPDTVRKALEAGELHGAQRTKNGEPVKRSRWRIHRDCLEAWLYGRPCVHQADAKSA